MDGRQTSPARGICTAVLGASACGWRDGEARRLQLSASESRSAASGSSTTRRRSGRSVDLAVAALRDAGAVRAPEAATDRRGLILGTQQGRTELIDRARRRQVEMRLPGFCDPNCFVGSISSVIPGAVAGQLGMHGLTLAVTNGRLSGLDAVGLAHHLLRSGGWPVLFAGGVDTADALALGEGAADFVDAAGVVGLAALESTGSTPGVHICDYRSGILAAMRPIGPDLAQTPRDAVVRGLLAVVTGHRDGPQDDAAVTLARSAGAERICIETEFGAAGCATGVLAVVRAAGLLQRWTKKGSDQSRTGRRFAVALDGTERGRLSMIVLTTQGKE